MSDKVYVDFSQIRKTFPTPKGPLCVVRDFNLQIARGEFVCLIGHSGCGKSTVLSMLAGLQETTSGVIVLAGKEVAGPGPDRGVVFQSPCLLPWMNALENVLLGVKQVNSGKPHRKCVEIACHFLEKVGLGEDLEKIPAELSQGMRQRVGIARAFALDPKMLLLDEPFGMLDGITRIQLQQELIALWEKDQKTVLMVTHDVDEAVFLADRVVMMTNGPEATVGRILDIDLPRPRIRENVLDNPYFYDMRGQVLEFLENPSRPLLHRASLTHLHSKTTHP